MKFRTPILTAVATLALAAPAAGAAPKLCGPWHWLGRCYGPPIIVQPPSNSVGWATRARLPIRSLGPTSLHGPPVTIRLGGGRGIYRGNG